MGIRKHQKLQFFRQILKEKADFQTAFGRDNYLNQIILQTKRAQETMTLLKIFLEKDYFTRACAHRKKEEKNGQVLRLYKPNMRVYKVLQKFKVSGAQCTAELSISGEVRD